MGKYNNTEIKTMGGKKNYDGNKQYNDKKPQRPAPVYSEFAVALKDQMVYQMESFLDADDRAAAVKNLFDVGGRYPAELKGWPEYAIYQVERSARMSRDNPEQWGRLTTALVVMDQKNGTLAFYCTCFITPNGDYNCTVYEEGENGPVYANTVRYDSRAKKHN